MNSPQIECEIMRLVFEHFGRHVLECAAEGGTHLVGRHAPAEVADLQHVVRVQQQVLRLQVAVDQAMLVQELYARARLDEVVECFILGHLLFVSYEEEEVPLGSEFQEQVYVVVIFDLLIQSHDVVMSYSLVNVHFSTECRQYLQVPRVALVDLLHCEHLASRLVDAQVHFPVGTLAQVLVVNDVDVCQGQFLAKFF